MSSHWISLSRRRFLGATCWTYIC